MVRRGCGRIILLTILVQHREQLLILPQQHLLTSVILTLTTSGGSCLTTSASKTLTVNPNPTVNAGRAVAAICQGGTTPRHWEVHLVEGQQPLFGQTAVQAERLQITQATTPGTATYTASASAPLSVILTLTTSGGSCGSVSDTKPLTVYQSVVITADPGPASQHSLRHLSW